MGVFIVITQMRTLNGHSICISQNENYDGCPNCLCKPCITDEQNRKMSWSNEPELPDGKSSFRKEKYIFFWTMLFHQSVFLDGRYRERNRTALNQTRDLELL